MTRSRPISRTKSDVPVPFRDLAAEDEPLVGILRIMPVLSAGTFSGALLLARTNGEPVEFVYNRLDVPVTSLCKPDRLPTFMTVMLVRSLFNALEGTPRWIAVAAGEVDAELFEIRIDVHVPVVALAPGGRVDMPGTAWLGTVPPPDEARTAVATLIDSGLAADLLTRTAAALRDAVARDTLDEPLVGGPAAS